MNHRFFNLILNVSTQEWPRILLAWNLNLFLRAGFVIGWTVTVAMFIHRIGIEALPYLFVLNALMIMVGSLLYSYLLQKINRQLLIIYTVLMGGAILLLSTLFILSNNFVFFGLILVAQSVVLSQLNILISLFTEDLFSPLESQRAFPLIATSETIGGIIGGLTVGLLSGVLVSYKFIYLWILSIFIIIPVLLTSHVYSKKISFIKIQNKEKKTERFHVGIDIAKKITTIGKKIKKIPFLQGLVTIVILQFMLFALVEFQYTKAVQISVLQGASSQGGHIENELTKNLGLLMMIFSLGSLIVQIFLASRLIQSLGIIGTLILHPLVTLLNLVGMTVNFNFFTAAISRSNFEITGKLFQNAYHSSYYAVSENIRDYIKEFIDGFIKPLGTILAFGLLLGVQKIAIGDKETLIINLSMILITGIMTLRLFRLKSDYTEVSYSNLDTCNDLPTRLNAIEILSEKGHKSDTRKLLRYLHDKKEKEIIKLKIIENLKWVKAPEAIQDIIDCMKSEYKSVRLAAIEALEEFEEIKKNADKKYVFTRHRIIEATKKLFEEEDSSEVRSAIIQLLAKIDHGDLIPFIIEALREGDQKIKRACIRACKKFEDASIAHYLKEYLNHKDFYVRAETIVALWSFEPLRNNLNHYLCQIKKSKQKEAIQATLYVLGETNNTKEYPYIFKQLSSSDNQIKNEAAKALGKLNHRASILHLANAWIEAPEKFSKFSKTLSLEMRESIEQLVHQKISNLINEIIEKSNGNTYEEMDSSTLLQLRDAFATVEEYEEVFKIEKIIQSQKKSLNQLTQENALAS